MKRRNRISTGLIIAGLFFLIIAGFYAGYNIWDAKRAQNVSESIVKKMEQSWDETPVQIELEEYRKEEPEKKVITIDGKDYLGTLEIPSASIVLPICMQYSEDNLKESPCIYQGSLENQDLVIAGHNYQRHFSPLKWIKAKTKIRIRTADNKMISYRVAMREELNGDEVERLITKTNWDLTLFTCNTGGNKREAIRCIAE